MYVSAVPTSRNLRPNQKSQVQVVQQRIEVVKKSSVSDLRVKLSGVPSQRPQLSSTVQVAKPVKDVIKSDKPAQKRDPPPTATPVIVKKVSTHAPESAPSAPPIQSQEKVRINVVFSYSIVSRSIITVPLFVLL